MSSLTPMRMHGGTGEACQNFSIFVKSTGSSCSTPMRMHGGTGGACPIFSPFRHSPCSFTTTAMMTVLWGAVEIFCRNNHPSKHYPMSNYSPGRYELMRIVKSFSSKKNHLTFVITDIHDINSKVAESSQPSTENMMPPFSGGNRWEQQGCPNTCPGNNSTWGNVSTGD